MRTVNVNLGTNSYRILIGAGILSRCGREIVDMGLGEDAAVITNPVVSSLHGGALEKSLADAGLKVAVLEVPDGEEQKSLETAGELCGRLTQCHAERSTTVLALGGGVIGDLAGFVAATYMRGVPLIQIPTTLLAQVDSSIGGKTGVDHEGLKNKIGAFYQPRLVMADTDTLKTLPGEAIIDGLAEVIKYAVIRDQGILTYVEDNLKAIMAADSEAMEEVVFRCASIKADVVSQDEKEKGLRAILNFGHTVGHAVETVSNFGIEHGTAVAIGMVAEARIAHKMGMLGKNDLKRLEGIINRVGFKLALPEAETEKFEQAMTHDKKVVCGRVRFVLPNSLGKVSITDEVDQALVRQTIEEMQ